jgi:hypothetical protein
MPWRDRCKIDGENRARPGGNHYFFIMCRLFRRGSETTCQKTGSCRAQALVFAENCVSDERYQTKVYGQISAISLARKTSAKVATIVAAILCAQSNRRAWWLGHDGRGAIARSKLNDFGIWRGAIWLRYLALPSGAGSN